MAFPVEVCWGGLPWNVSGEVCCGGILWNVPGEVCCGGYCGDVLWNLRWTFAVAVAVERSWGGLLWNASMACAVEVAYRDYRVYDGFCGKPVRVLNSDSAAFTIPHSPHKMSI